MIGIYLICFFAFPAAILIQAKKNAGTNVLLEKNDTNAIKGIATGFVVLMHLTNNLEADSVITKLLLNLLSVTGGMGVLLFFFVSGYGIYKGYAHKTPDAGFLYKRLLNVYVPCLFIQVVFCLWDIMWQRSFDFREIVLRSLADAWFIYVILVQYIIFFVSWVISKGRQSVMLILSYMFSAITAVIFCLCGLNARWYNGLLLFPIGMTIAYKEDKLLIAIRKNRFLHMFVYSILFVLTGGAFTYWKGDFIAVDILKVIAGVCMSMLVCTIYTQVRLSSPIMQYIGKRSLFFYIVHLGLRRVVNGFESVNKVENFYIVLVFTFIIVELFYKLHSFVMRYISERGKYGKNI
ncbi:MAG: acyltransferase [Lachnospiraceae bacterium]|nr:acyltransferase [Lachnospiraceae bacterium]